MRSKRMLLLVAPLTVPACNRSQKSIGSIESEQSYSLCSRSDEARARLPELIQQFAVKNHASFVDRGAEAQAELAGMQISRGALDSTGGNLILLSVEKPNDFGFSLSNLGLKEKLALGVRWRGGRQDSRVAALLAELERFWVIQPVQAGVTDDPPCAPTRSHLPHG